MNYHIKEYGKAGFLSHTQFDDYEEALVAFYKIINLKDESVTFIRKLSLVFIEFSDDGVITEDVVMGFFQNPYHKKRKNEDDN
jgi:hypothetical protein